MANHKVIAALIAAAVIIGGFFIFKNNTVAPVVTDEIGATQGDLAGETSELATREFTIETKNFSFTPSMIEVYEGERVRITLKNTQGMHDLKIDEFNVGTKTLNTAGQTETIEFIADKAGQYEYYCSIGTHRQMGMKGTLVVKQVE